MDDYTASKKDYQQNRRWTKGSEETCVLHLPSDTPGFDNMDTETMTAKSGRRVNRFSGIYGTPMAGPCPECDSRMHINNTVTVNLWHLPVGPVLSILHIERYQYRCPECGKTLTEGIPFKADRHMATVQLVNYTEGLLASGQYTLKAVADITGLGKNVVKEIDRLRLEERYTVKGEDGREFRKPERQARHLGIDEFKLHDNHQYATHIIDLESGHVLWIAKGKKKQVVYDFIRHVGPDWMGGVDAVACDMNSDFQEAFEEMCPHLTVVYDRFHIVKNFNDNVVTKVRIDEIARLRAQGDEPSAQALKRSKLILTSSRQTLERKDREAAEGKAIKKGSELFDTPDVTRKPGHMAKYEELLASNRLFFTADIVKGKLSEAFLMLDEHAMADEIEEIIGICDGTGNEHFKRFGRMLLNHFEGIIAHATYQISSGRIEGLNNKIKTLRRMAYGLPDDDYFFLKVMDSSRRDYVRNPSPHKIND